MVLSVMAVSSSVLLMVTFTEAMREGGEDSSKPKTDICTPSHFHRFLPVLTLV